MTLLAAAGALWLGVLTSISPCPLAMNVLAVSYLSRQADRKRLLPCWLAYVLGGAVTYLTLGAMAVWGLTSVPALSRFVQKYAAALLGPVLVLAGMVLAGLIQSPRALRFSSAATTRAAGGGVAGAALLGALLALSFCPSSAALYFGGLVPLSLEHRSVLLLPALYALGAALPVILLSLLLWASSTRHAAALSSLSRAQSWIARASGAAFIVVGVYECLHQVWGLF